jgi:glycerophosphoryl diester phosphodiesterase
MMRAYPCIIAHRCGGVLAPENSLAGLAVAARLGCRAVEFDVMLTADGVPVLMHDETLERTTRCTGRVAGRTLDEIRAGDPAVPTLAEAIAACRQLGLWANIELKPASGYAEATGAVVGAWLAKHWDGHGVISSFSEKSALAARHALPDVAFALLCERLPADWRAAAGRLNAGAIHLAAEAVDARTAAALVAGGLPWAVYTVNERASAADLFALGAAAIFTDRPDLWAPTEMQAGFA